MQSGMTQYVPVWQTWNLISTRSRTSTDISTTSSSTTVVASSRVLRERMQIARIQNRLTVHELAQRVRCDVETLAAFERGEGVVSDEVQARLVSELRL